MQVTRLRGRDDRKRLSGQLLSRPSTGQGRSFGGTWKWITRWPLCPGKPPTPSFRITPETWEPRVVAKPLTPLDVYKLKAAVDNVKRAGKTLVPKPDRHADRERP